MADGLQTIAIGFIFIMCSAVITSSLPVAVTKMSARLTASSMVTTSNPSIAACSAQIGSISVTITRAAAVTQARCRTLADIAVTGNAGDLAGQHHVGRAAESRRPAIPCSRRGYRTSTWSRCH